MRMILMEMIIQIRALRLSVSIFLIYNEKIILPEDQWQKCLCPYLPSGSEIWSTHKEYGAKKMCPGSAFPPGQNLILLLPSPLAPSS